MRPPRHQLGPLHNDQETHLEFQAIRQIHFLDKVISARCHREPTETVRKDVSRQTIHYPISLPKQCEIRPDHDCRNNSLVSNLVW